MKKNAMMKIAAILMVAVLLTTCAISSTFAKYTTSGESADAARVAAFGVKVATKFDTLFSSKYDSDTNVSVEAGELGYTINDLVAPGTEGGVTTASVITGTPEVAVELNTVATVTLTGWELADGTFYCPLTFVVNTTPIDGKDHTSAESLQNAIVNAIGAGTEQFAPGTVLDDKEIDVSITWKWAFETVEVDNPETEVDEIAEADAKDTYLGDCAAKKIEGKTAPQISIKITQTITQMDTIPATQG